MQALKGSLVALVTPLSESGEVDYPALQNLLDWHVEQGTNGIVSVEQLESLPHLILRNI
jgi:4-hydroxy-tetrahydrodipicolinate synthase